MRAEMTKVVEKVDAMQPHVKTVENLKTTGATTAKALALISAAAAGIGSVVALGLSYIKPWLLLSIGKH